MNADSIKKFDYEKIAKNCVKCGKCATDCTIFNINKDEATSPRGFIDILGAHARGEVELDKNLKEITDKCFLCTTCTSVCPNALPTDEIIENIRYEMGQKFGIAAWKRIFFALLNNRAMLDCFYKIAAIFSPLLYKKQNDRAAIVPRFCLPVVKRRVFMPFFYKSFLNSHSEIVKARGEIESKNIESSLDSIESNPQKSAKERKVAIFIGCFGNYNYKEIGESLLEILGALNITAILPKAQKCCGAPAYFTGDFKAVQKLLDSNLPLFEKLLKDGVEAILVPEATCAAMILEDWERFLERSPFADSAKLARFRKIKGKIFMASAWLNSHTELKEILKAKNTARIQYNIESKNATNAHEHGFLESITYHDPCHARKVLKVWKEPRELLSAAGYELREMSESSACCGFGGVSIQAERFSLAQKVGAKKAQMINQTQAHFISAECSACRMQITNSLAEFAKNVKSQKDSMKNNNLDSIESNSSSDSIKSNNLDSIKNNNLVSMKFNSNIDSIESNNAFLQEAKEPIFAHPLELIARALRN